MANGPWGPGITEVEPIKINIKFRYQTSLMQTGFYLRKGTALLGTPQDAAEHVTTELLPSFKIILTTADVIEGVDAVNIVSKDGGSTSPAAMVGNLGTALTPTLLCVPVALKGEKRYKYGQGRMFLPVREESMTTADSLNTVGSATIQAFVDKLVELYVGSVNTRAWRLINCHEAKPARPRKKGGALLPAVDATWYDVASVRVNPLITALRSRKAGKGS